MRQIISRSVASVLSIAFFCAGCGQSGSGSRLTPANYDQVTLGMDKTQVEKILGQPTKVESKQSLVFEGTESKWEPVETYRYENNQTLVTIVFRNDKVETKESNLGREP